MSLIMGTRLGALLGCNRDGNIKSGAVAFWYKLCNFESELDNSGVYWSKLGLLILGYERLVTFEFLSLYLDIRFKLKIECS